MMDTQTTHKLITPFADGVILHHPDQLVSDMISLEKRGAYWLKQEYSKPLDLPELAVMLNRWYRGQFSKGQGVYSLNHEDKEAERENWKTTIWNPNTHQAWLTIYSNQIRQSDFTVPKWQERHALTIPEAAAILKRWYE